MYRHAACPFGSRITASDLNLPVVIVMTVLYDERLPGGYNCRRSSQEYLVRLHCKGWLSSRGSTCVG